MPSACGICLAVDIRQQGRDTCGISVQQEYHEHLYTSLISTAPIGQEFIFQPLGKYPLSWSHTLLLRNIYCTYIYIYIYIYMYILTNSHSSVDCMVYGLRLGFLQCMLFMQTLHIQTIKNSIKNSNKFV